MTDELYIFRPSFSQQRLWFLDQMMPGTAVYNLSEALRLTGALDVAALERSLNEIVRRHESLRTTFAVIDDQLVQVVAPALRLSLPLVDLAHLPGREAQALHQASQEAQRPFDLEHGPLVRALLLRLEDREHILVATMHHIISDGWSLGVLTHELSVLYSSFVQGTPAPLPELPIQYADFAHWQREWLQGDVLERYLRYWREQLEPEDDHAPAVLELPTDYPRPAVPTFAGDTLTFALPRDLTSQLVDLSQRENTTLFMTLLAAWQVLLARYSGQDDIVVGTPIAGRIEGETEALIGFFVNTLVLRTNLSNNPTFRAALQRVREVTLGAYAHQELPFDRLVEELRLQRDLNRNPLFQVMFALQNMHMPSLSLPGLSLSPVPLPQETARLDLALALEETPTGINGLLEYSTEIFDPWTIARLAEQYQTLLAEIVKNPEQRILDLRLLSPAEQQRILVEWNATQAAYSADLSLHQLVEAQVIRTPEAVAVTCEGEQITYDQLNRRANQLAHYLQAAGVGSTQTEARVGLCMERSIEMIVGILAILKVGGVYVPLDPAYPEQRLHWMVEDAGVAILLTQEQFRRRIPVQEVQVITLNHDCAIHGASTQADGQGAALARQTGTNLGRAIDPDQAAYIMYTSGSTGRPKGVVVPHRAIVNRLHWSQQTYPLTSADRLLHIASFSFDISLWEIFGPLMAGARLVLPRAGGYPDSGYLAALLSQEQITIVHFVPSLLRVILDEPTLQPKRLHLRALFCGGDTIPTDVIKQALTTLGVALYEWYGPTEAAINATSYQPCLDSQLVALGQPIANMEIYVLDPRGCPVPIGVPGTIHIGGVGLARGYHQRPDLTAEHFIPHPFGDHVGLRLYCTGDRGRWRADGTLEFLGRIDQQVKLRGVRIEPGEIEALLGVHPAIREAVVAVREDPSAGGIGAQRLVAYVVPRHFTAKQAPRLDQPELWPSIGEYPVYDEFIYSVLTTHERRNQRYLAALERLAKDRVVVDIGAGGDAILAQLAIEAGARRVYAIEILEASYRAARQRIAALGLADRIILIHGDAMEVDLPEPATVCVTETFETIGGAEGAVVLLNTARRLLTPDGVFIPERSTTYIAAVRLPDAIREQPRFGEVSGRYVQKIFEQIGYRFDLRLCIRNIPASLIMSDSGIFEDLRFPDDASPSYQREVTLTITQDSQIDGFLLWLKLQLSEGEAIDTLDDQYSWAPVFFPVFYPGITVTTGDRINAICADTLSQDGVHPDYTITGTLTRRDGTTIPFTYESPHHQHQYQATPFYRQLFDQTDHAHEELIPALRSYLATHLPATLIPSAFVTLESLPLSPNGKVDRQALPAPDAQPEAVDRPYIAPETPIEHELAELWQQLLGVKRISVDDDFFALGGHSLLSMQLIARVRSQFAVSLDIRGFFAQPTLRQMAQMIEETMLVQVSDTRIDELLDGLDDLDDDEIKRLLDRPDESHRQE